MKELLVIVPSRGRPESVVPLSWACTAFGAGRSDLLVATDDDDEEYPDVPGVLFERNPRLRMNGTLNLVANKYAKKALVSVAYAIGRAEPVMVEAFSETGRNLTAIVNKHFDFRPAAIIERLDLRRPIYRATAAYGHFGLPAGMKASARPWEEIVKI